jgi:hypothetical protein
LEDAWDATPQTKRSLRDELRYRESQAMATVAGGSFDQVSANGRMTRFAPQGPGQNTPVDMAEAYRELIDLLDDARRFLKFCAQWGLSAFDAFANGVSTPDQATIWQQFFENAGDPNGVVEAGNLASQCYDTTNQKVWLRDSGQGRGNTGWY